MAYGYITKLNENVLRKHVRYQNRYNIAIAGDLYYAKDLDENQKYPAIIVGAPYGGVKEQGPCVYANELAQRGFVVLTFDQVFMGESGGEPRNISSPEMFVESFSAAVDFLGTKVSFVNRERIGVIGICGSGGFALSAAQVDTRIKAIATASMYDISYSKRKNKTMEELEVVKEKLSIQRWADYENGYPEYIPSFPEVPLSEIPADISEGEKIWFQFYGVKRGHHPNARGEFTTTSSLSFMNFRLLEDIHEISPRPILFIVGEKAHSKEYSEIAYHKAKNPKEMYIVEGANHIDLYDNVQLIPFHKLEEFFKEYL